MPQFNIRTRTAFYFFVTLTAIFGGIHCAAWSYPFARAAETRLWRLCAILTTLLPVLTILLPLTLDKIPEPNGISANRMIDILWGFLTYLVPAHSICGRLCTIIECFDAFEDAPVGINAKVDWSTYLAHIG